MENANSHSQREKNSTEEESLMAIDTIIIGTLCKLCSEEGVLMPPLHCARVAPSIDLGQPTNRPLEPWRSNLAPNKTPDLPSPDMSH